MAKIENLFQKLTDQGGSDLHLEQGQRPKMRVNGKLAEIAGEELLTLEAITGLLKDICAADGWRHFEHNGDLDFAYAWENQARFRANYYRQFFGLGAVFRIIPSSIKSLDELAMPRQLKDFDRLRAGVILVTGPTGSGKSTTLAAIIDHINATQTKKIITIEEPVEFIHKAKLSLITHREVGEDTPSFADGLKTAIKSDVDIILVGEMRDRETIELALAAAEMGILVFGTLHTNSAPKTIDRIVDVFPLNQKNRIRTILANTLRAIVAQQLVVSADGSRRYAALEILLRSPALGAIIQSGDTVKLTSEIQLNRQNGMVLMDDSLAALVQAGKITKVEAFLKALDKSKFD